MTDPKYLITSIDDGYKKVLNFQISVYENLSSKETENQLRKMSSKDEMKNLIESRTQKMKKDSNVAIDNLKDTVMQGIDNSPYEEIIKHEIIPHFLKRADQTTTLMDNASDIMKKGITAGNLSATIAGAAALSAGILTFDAAAVGLAFFGPVGLAAAGCITIIASLVSIFV